MGVYLKEFAPKIEGKGIRKISLLISHSFKTKSVYFEIYNYQDKWFLYWNFETPQSVIFQGIKNSGKKTMPPEDWENEEILRNIHKLCESFECELNDEDASVVKQFLAAEMPEVVQKPMGLDGHSYTVNIYETEKEYNCWGAIPKEWACLEPLIEMVVDKAGLPDEYLILGIG